MKPFIKIELDELKEYRDGLDEIIKAYEKMNELYDEKIKKLEMAGFDLEEVDKIIDILFKDY